MQKLRKFSKFSSNFCQLKRKSSFWCDLILLKSFFIWTFVKQKWKKWIQVWKIFLLFFLLKNFFEIFENFCKFLQIFVMFYNNHFHWLSAKSFFFIISALTELPAAIFATIFVAAIRWKFASIFSAAIFPTIFFAAIRGKFATIFSGAISALSTVSAV